MSKTTNSFQDNEEAWEDLDLNDSHLQSLLDNPLETPDTSRLRDGEQHVGFDNNMGESWIYPNNLPCRSYQMSIVQAALYRNTLVVLPTGLGKTFIAAVVMYNLYRWYPRGKIIFMAPTRPLVNQQIEACQKIMPFPNRDTVELTGKLQKAKRLEMWKTKRVFFATPQVVQSDIFGGRPQAGVSMEEQSFEDSVEAKPSDFPFDQIKLLVIDEAHKAKGKYAYTEVTQAIARQTKYFRVLALSATPGRTMDDVAEVCRNLLISHLEVRWDTSIDVLPYVHKRSMDTVVVSMSDEIKEIKEQLLLIVDPYLRQLTEAEVLSGSLTNINRNFLLFQQKSFRERSFHNGRHPQHSAICSNFSICISLYHALELLERHGLRVFLNNFEEDEEGKGKFILQMDRRLSDLVEKLKQQMGPNPFEFSAAPMTNGKIAEIPKDLDFGHPKFEKTRECLLRHFETNEDSRAIVFCEYRESVMLIYRMLLQHVPLLKPRCFVGQGGTGSLRALTQKQQIQIMNDFRSGKSNILIATSIGEEGIDVGEVELIVCFDISTSNPTRFVQRIGRTGRKKNGHVIMMVTEGREQQILRDVLSNKDQVNKRLLRSHVVQQALYKHSPRLVPTEFKPKCIQTYVKPPEDDEEPPSPSKKAKKSLNSKVKSPDKGNQDLRKFFQKKPKEMDKEEMEFFESDTGMTQAKPGAQTQQRIVNKLDKMKNLFKDLQSPIATQTQRPNKESQTKLSNSQGSIKDFFREPKAKNKTNDKSGQVLNDSLNSPKDINDSTIDLCEDEDNNHDQESHKEPIQDTDEEEDLRNLLDFLTNTHTTPEVLKRAEIKDFAYHLKSAELSKEIKIMLLKNKPEYIKETLEQIQVLKALYDNDTSDYTKEEKSIREINTIILELFGGLENVEKFLEEYDLEKYKQKCLDADSDLEEEDPEEMNKFMKSLDSIFEGLDDGKKHDNSEWIKEQFRDSTFFKTLMEPPPAASKPLQTQVQESMVYETFNESEEDNTMNILDDCSISETKYCSQWQEFNKPDIAFKSTPLQGSTNKSFKRLETTRKTSLLTRLEETKEEYEEEEVPGNTSVETKQVQNALEILAEKLKDQSFNETITTKSPQEELEDLENTFKTKRKDCEQKFSSTKHSLSFKEEDDLVQKELEQLENVFITTRKDFEIYKKQEADKFSSTTNEFEDFNLADEDDFFMAAAEAELKFTQNQTKQIKTDDSSSINDPNKTPDLPELTSNNDFNYPNKLTPPSLNSTPELDLSHANIREINKRPSITSTLPTPPERSLQQELEIDMEAFMDPFPEEQELVKTSQTFARRESFKENITTLTIVRESPDLFAEEHQQSPIKKPLAYKIKPSLASKLSSKVNVQRCQSSLPAATVFKSPQKTFFSSQQPSHLLTSPSSRLPTDKQKQERSPSLFDMYLKNTKGKVKLPKALANTSAASLLSMNSSNNFTSSNDLKDSPVIKASQQNDSPIAVRSRSGKASKRKIFDSDSEQENDEYKDDVRAIEEEDEGDSDFEEVAATQGLDESSFIQHRKKRRRFNSFIEQEAGVSGSDQSEDEADNTIGCYIHDSVVVASDDEDPDQASTSHMQAMYLQSLKSPQQRRGAFKIPAPRVFNDHSRIFSQAVLPEETYSQYIPDSFVVEEDDSFINDRGDVSEISMCPLEKAEKILKERKRAKKLGLVIEDNDEGVKKKVKGKKKIQIIHDSSDDDFE